MATGTPKVPAAKTSRPKGKRTRRLPNQPPVGEVPCTLRQHRLSRGWTAGQLATKVGTTRSMISMLETGRSQASVPLARRIARVIGWPIESIWPETAEAKP